jgi:retinol dehydrogenase-14
MAGSTEPRPPILITGASGAIGQATARALAREDRALLLWVRDAGRGARTRDALRAEFPGASIELADGDLARLASVRAQAIRLASTHPRLDAIVHTAAVLTRHREETPEGLERMFATNHLGPFLLTKILTEWLEPSHPLRVVFVSAPATTPLAFDDLQSRRKFRSLTAFGASKTANNLLAYALARRFGRGARTSNIFFPGIVRSSLMREAPLLIRAFSRAIGSPPDRAGESLAWLATGPPLASTTGTFFDGTRIGSTTEYTLDVQNQERLWEESERIIASVR